MKKMFSIIVLLLLIVAPATKTSGLTLSYKQSVKPVSSVQSFCVKTGSSKLCFPVRISNSSANSISKLVLQNANGQVIKSVATVSKANPVNQNPSIGSDAMQQEMLGYINAERSKNNAPALVLDQKLSEGAAMKSKDMAQNNYFSHTSPTYGSPFDMMKSLGITYRTAGENIAKHTSVKGAHDAFMNSAGHRANILNSSFKRIGLGFYSSGNYLYVTQWFTN